jgi:hypothetical protein
MQVTVRNAEAVKARLERGIDKALIVLKRRVDTASAELQGRIVAGLAAGTYGIHSRHGMSGLAGSVQVTPAGIEGTTVRGGVHGAGGTAWYGTVHERGGLSSYDISPVDRRALAWLAFGTPAKAAKHQRAFGFTKDMIVVAHVTHPPLRQRRWMGGPVDELRARIMDIVGGPIVSESFAFGG